MSDEVKRNQDEEEREKRTLCFLESVRLYFEDPQKSDLKELLRRDLITSSLPNFLFFTDWDFWNKCIFESKNPIVEGFKIKLKKLENGNRQAWSEFLSGLVEFFYNTDLVERFEKLSPFSGDSGFFKMRDRIIEIHEEQERLEKEYNKLLKILKENCDHASVIETDCVSRGMVSTTKPPARRCLICGEIENGWGCGYKKLKNTKPIKTVSREEFDSARKLRLLKTKSDLIPVDFE